MSDTAGIKVTRRRGYTVVYNDLLPADGSLSARAWGLYVYLAGRPDGWETRVSHLRTVFKEGRDALYNALGELVEAGLMSREEVIDDGLRRTRYGLNADPVERETSRSAPDPDFQDPGNPGPGNPDAGTPDPEKPGQVSTEVASTDSATTEKASAPSLREGAMQTGDGPLDGMPEPGLTQAQRAEQIARNWWTHYESKYGPIVKNNPRANPHLVLRNMIEGALEKYTEDEIKRALVGPADRTPDAIPTTTVFHRHLSEVRKHGVAGQSSNVRHLPNRHDSKDPAERERITRNWEGTGNP